MRRPEKRSSLNPATSTHPAKKVPVARYFSSLTENQNFMAFRYRDVRESCQSGYAYGETPCPIAILWTVEPFLTESHRR